MRKKARRQGEIENLGVTMSKSLGKTTWKRYAGFRLRGSESGKLAAAKAVHCRVQNGVISRGLGITEVYGEALLPIACMPKEDILRVYVLDIETNGEAKKAWFVLGQDGVMYQRADDGSFVAKAVMGRTANFAVAHDVDGNVKVVAVGKRGAFLVDGEEWSALTLGSSEADEASAAALRLAENVASVAASQAAAVFGSAADMDSAAVAVVSENAAANGGGGTEENGATSGSVSDSENDEKIENGATMYALNGNLTGFAGAVCFYKNRVWLAEGVHKIWYGSPETPWDFSAEKGGGFVYLPLGKGEIFALVGYAECVFAFCERGIWRIAPDGLGERFSVREVSVCFGRIVPNTVVRVGGEIFFLTNDGVCRFDGTRAEMVARDMEILPFILREDNHCAAVGEYYVVEYLDNRLHEVRTVAVREDGEDGYDLDCLVGLQACDGGAVCATDGYFLWLRTDGRLPQGAKACFESVESDLGLRGRKVLKTLELDAEGSFSVEVFNGKTWRKKDVRNARGRVVWKVFERAERFAFRFTFADDARIKSMALELEQIAE